jgi:hypothetical protein
MRNLLYLELITYALIISGYVVSMIFPKDTIAGLSCVSIGLFTLIILRTVPLTHAPEINIGILIPVIPAVIILAISIWILSINIKYSKKIKEGNITEEYKTFNSISFVLLLIQLVLLYKNNIPYSFSIISLLASFQMIIVFIMQMNLEYFITDG